MVRRSCPFFALLATSTVVASAANATPSASDETLCREIERLKTLYLHCERSAESNNLTTSEIQRCSEIYYDLKERAFGGEFARIRAWYETTIQTADEGLAERIMLDKAGESCS